LRVRVRHGNVPGTGGLAMTDFIAGLPVIDSARPILERLDALGSAMSIANFLSNEGIAGYKESAVLCPLAVYLTRETGKEWVVGTDTVRASLYNDSPYPVIRPDIPIGVHVRQFIRLFDAGVYPDLVRDFAPDDYPVFV
ncbi:MAG: hypothetical protein ACREMY_05315, partial [bacterium]